MRKLLWICVLAASAALVNAQIASAQTTVILRATLTGGEETPNPVLPARWAPSKWLLIRLRRK
jgi:hypothetical protein